MVRALSLPLCSVLIACGGQAAPAPAPPAAAAPVVSNQACECACECDADLHCDCACQCDGAEVGTEVKVSRTLPAQRVSGHAGDDTAEPPDWTGRVTKVDELHYRITRATVEEILDDPLATARGARIVPSIKDGEANGFKLYAIRPSSVYAALGIRNGDTLKAVNGMALDDPAKALEVYSAVRNVSRLELDITRRGKDVLLVIEIE